jgi:hypothetical protein
MPPAKKTNTNRLASGAGITAGLELHLDAKGKITLLDTTTDARFAEDVALWSAGLNPPARKKTKNAAITE